MQPDTSPRLSLDPDLLAAADGVLREGETLSNFTEASVRAAIQRRRTRTEFVAQGLASREEARCLGGYVDAAVVHAQLVEKLARARAKLQTTGGA